MNNGKAILSLFDYSGQWAQPWLRRGYDVVQWDIKLDRDIYDFDSVETFLDMFPDTDFAGILAAVPCTDFASSGARWFAEKDAAGQTLASIELVKQTLRLVDLLRPTDPTYEDPFFWVIENPVGRIGTLVPSLPTPMYFDPWEYAGHLNPSPAALEELNAIRAKNGVGVTSEEAQRIIDLNAYTKRTGLWGEFNRNIRRKPIAPVKGNEWGTPLMRLGGKSAKTKEIRSNTPEGFAEAFCLANLGYVAHKSNTQLQIQL